MQYGSRALAFYVLSADPKSDVGKKCVSCLARSNHNTHACSHPL